MMKNDECFGPSTRNFVANTRPTPASPQPRRMSCGRELIDAYPIEKHEISTEKRSERDAASLCGKALPALAGAA
jgi:hypothetical protein